MANERGAAETCLPAIACRRWDMGVGRTDWWGGSTHNRVRNQTASRTLLEEAARGGESPVGESSLARVGIREYGGTREIPSEAGGTTLQG